MNGLMAPVRGAARAAATNRMGATSFEVLMITPMLPLVPAWLNGCSRTGVVLAPALSLCYYTIRDYRRAGQSRSSSGVYCHEARMPFVVAGVLCCRTRILAAHHRI